MVYVKVVDGFTNLVPRFAGYLLEEEDVGPGNYIFAWKVEMGWEFEKYHFIPRYKSRSGYVTRICNEEINEYKEQTITIVGFRTRQQTDWW